MLDFIRGYKTSRNLVL